MTAQVADEIWFEGRCFRLAAEPLGPWLWRKKNKHIRFGRVHSACSRGYRCTWEVVRGRLYLTRFSAKLPDGTPATMESLFENYSEQYYASVKANDPANAGPGRFAFWVTGTLACPFGELLEYEHFGYASTYERELQLSCRDGFIIGSRIVENRRPTQPRSMQSEALPDVALEEQALPGLRFP